MPQSLRSMEGRLPRPYWTGKIITKPVVFTVEKSVKWGKLEANTIEIELVGKAGTALGKRPYDGFHQDRADLRDTYLIKKQNIQASSGKASAAAYRVFSRIAFVGMSKADVLRLLGDPETISDYGKKQGGGEDAPLVYIFDNGMDGDQWTLLFQNGIVTKVEHTGIE